MAYTLQTGREAMEERLGFIVASVDELLGKMRAWLAGEQGIEQTWQGSVKRGNDSLSLFSTDADLQQTVGKWIAANRLSDRKSTRLNSSHGYISYAVFCLKKKKNQ